MKIIKLSKKDYSDLEGLLNKAGLVKGNEAYPSMLYVSKNTYLKIKRSLINKFKKQNPHVKSEKIINYGIGCHLLNLGPNIIEKKDGGSFLPDGIAIVCNQAETQIENN